MTLETTENTSTREIEVIKLFCIGAKVYSGYNGYVLILLDIDWLFWSVSFVHRLAHPLCSNTLL